MQAKLVSLRAELFFAVNEQLAPAVQAMAAGVDLPAVLTPALPPVPSIADMLHVRSSKHAPQPAKLSTLAAALYFSLRVIFLMLH